MLLDSTHKKWFLVTLLLGVSALGVYLTLRWTTTSELTGGSLVGMWYGIAGYGLMIYAGLLGLLRKVPGAWWLGQRRTWLRGHIWFGVLSGVFILCHSGFRWGGLLEILLWIVLLLVFATGILGLVLQQILPRLLTSRVPREAPLEQIPYMCEVMRREADTLVDRARTNADLGAGVKEQLDALYTNEVRPFLAAGYGRRTKLADPVQLEAVFTRVRRLAGFDPLAEQLNQLQDFCEQRRQLGEQERLHRWLHAWLLVHVPLSIMLLVLGAAHAVLALYY